MAKVLFKVINHKGVLNLGGEAKYIYDFAKDKENLKKIYLKKNDNIGMPFDSSIILLKLKKIIRKK